MSAHIGIPLIRTYHKLPSHHHGKVHARKGRLAGKEFLPEMQPGRMRKELRIGIACRRAQVLMKDLADLFFLLMYTRQYDMTGRLTRQLDHPLSQVGVYHIDALLSQE